MRKERLRIIHNYLCVFWMFLEIFKLQICCFLVGMGLRLLKDFMVSLCEFKMFVVVLRVGVGVPKTSTNQQNRT